MSTVRVKLGRAFGLPPGVSGSLLWSYLRFPALVALFVLVLYAATLATVAAFSDLSLELVFSAGQVFTGLAGIGAAVVAIAGLAKQFEPARADLRLVVTGMELRDTDQSATFELENVGQAPAFGVEVILEGAGTIHAADLGDFTTRQRTGVNGTRLEHVAEGHIVPPSAAAIPVGRMDFPRSTIRVVADCYNRSSAVWPNPDFNEPPTPDRPIHSA